MEYRPRNPRKNRRRPPRWQRWLVLPAAALVIFGAARLIGYGADWLSARNTARELREVYYDAATETPTAAPTPTPTPAPTAIAAATPLPAQTPGTSLPSLAYPNNPKMQISSRFKVLRKESKYIVGWLTVSSILDEPMVQRDNEYYLTHDAKGKENVNGALFLDAAISLKTRPYTLTVYGHNMKSGAMFGSLRNYENSGYYHSAPIITFDTMYETGRYVIFSVGTVSTDAGARNSVDFLALLSSDISQRQSAIDSLQKASLFTNKIDVTPDDQLLLLVTCTEKDEERRVVAARHVRDGEDENTLSNLARKSRKK